MKKTKLEPQTAQSARAPAAWGNIIKSTIVAVLTAASACTLAAADPPDSLKVTAQVRQFQDRTPTEQAASLEQIQQQKNKLRANREEHLQFLSECETTVAEAAANPTASNLSKAANVKHQLETNGRESCLRDAIASRDARTQGVGLYKESQIVLQRVDVWLDDLRKATSANSKIQNQARRICQAMQTSQVMAELQRVSARLGIFDALDMVEGKAAERLQARRQAIQDKLAALNQANQDLDGNAQESEWLAAVYDRAAQLTLQEGRLIYHQGVLDQGTSELQDAALQGRQNNALHTSILRRTAQSFPYPGQPAVPVAPPVTNAAAITHNP